ncbi:peptidoglycan DD-metalloendopeptidase family protein [Desulfocurvus sp. DL9XJH121]
MIGNFDATSPLVAGDAPEEVRRKLALDEVRRNLKSSGPGQEEKLRKATQGFEAIFINKLWSEMRKSVPKEGMLHSREEDAYVSMFEREMSVKMAESGGIGLGKMLFEQLKEQLADSASGTRSRTLPQPDLSMAEAKKPIPLDKPKDTIKSLEDAQRVKSLQEAGLVLRQAAAQTPGPAETADAMPQRMEPDFNPLADTDPNVGAAASAPPEIMRKALNLAARIEMGDAKARAVAQARSAAPAADADKGLPGALVWPAQGGVSEGFGWRTDAATGERFWKPGVEIAAGAGAPVKAGWDGKVVFVGQRGETGDTVVLEHADGWRSIYGQAGKIKVGVGDRVNAGSIIATMGSDRQDSPASLYFEIRKGEQAFNPETLRERRQNVASVEKR